MAVAPVGGGVTLPMPLPVTTIVCGLPTPLLVIVSVVLRAPAVFGWNVNDSAHDDAGGHASRSCGRPAGTPPALLLVIGDTATVAVPVLVMMERALLTVPTSGRHRLRDGHRQHALAAAAVAPVPLMLTLVLPPV